MYSVVIPAKNESRNIARCIQSVFASVSKACIVEVIVVDNGSSDDTVEIASAEGAKVFVKTGVNISALRNLGVEKSQFEIIGFIDADCEAVFGWLENGERILTDITVGVVGDYYRLPKDPKWIEKAYFSSVPRRLREVGYLSGGNMVLRKDTFLQVGGFDESTVTGEDYVLCQKIKAVGFKIISDPTVSVIHHGNPKTLVQLFKREVWCGLGMIDLYRYGKLTLPLLWSLLNCILIVCILLAVISRRFDVAMYQLLILFSLPMGAVIWRCWNNKSLKGLLPLYFIYMAYGFGRTASLFKRLTY